jgi:putative addiction module killer protein
VLEVVETPEYTAWVDNLKDKAGKVRIAARVLRLKLGNPGDAKNLGDGVFELRIHVGPGYRVYYHVEGQKVLLLLCGGDKSSQASDIALAKLIAAEWKGTLK